MPKGSKAPKPDYNYINADDITDKVNQVFNDCVVSLGYDPNSPADRKAITHNEVNYCLRQVYIKLFKPEKALYNNQKSLVNYDDIDLLTVLANVFIDLCFNFNKSLGLMSFSYLVGVDYTTLNRWLNDRESNPKRYDVLKCIQENHKAAQIGLLNGSPVGALAVANNDKETGLEWAKNNAPTITNNTVYFLPSERADRLKLEQSV